MENATTKKYTWYAVQVPPVEQESDFYDFELDGVIFYGNRDFQSVGEELIDEWNLKSEEVVDDALNNNVKQMAEIISHHFPKMPKEAVTEIVHLYEQGKGNTPECVCLGLQAITGKVYRHMEVDGDVQREWQDVYYPAEEWTEDQIRDLGIRYFDNGSAWFCVDAGDVESEDPEQIWKSQDGFYHYSTEWKDEKIRQELADNVGCGPEDLKMFPFAGYVTTPSWNV